MSIRIFLVDDHAIVRDGLQMLLESQPDIQVIGVASDGCSAVEQIEKTHPEIAILDIDMPKMSGIEAAREIRARCPETQVIILSMHSTGSHVMSALSAGAQGFLLKASAGRSVVDAIRSVKAGKRYLDAEVLDQVVESSLLQHNGHTDKLEPLELLSPRERQVLMLLVEGKTNQEAALLLHISPKTVETYRSNLMKKLQVSNLAELIKYAIRAGMITVD